MTEEQFRHEAKRLRPSLIMMARGFLEQKEDAEDAAQDALLKLWSMVDDLNSPMEHLAKAVVRNLCISRLRLKTKKNKFLSDYKQDSNNDSPETYYIEKMMTLIDKLPPKQQIVVRLRHFDGMEISDIASLTGANEAALRKQLSRARQALRTMFLSTKET